MRSTRARYVGPPLLMAATVSVVTMLAGPVAAIRPAPVPRDDIRQHPAQVSALFSRFVPSEVRIRSGDRLTFGNYDPTWWGMDGHSLDEVVPNCTAPPYTGNNPPNPDGCGYPRFSSGLVDHGYAKPVAGVEALPPGTYEFLCMVHPGMRGKLMVE